MKLVLKIFAGLIVVVAVVFGVAVYNLDKVIKEAVVQVGPDVTDTRVELDSVNLSILNGNAALKGLVIGNPEGFEKPTMFSLDSIDVDLDVQSLREDVILIHKIFIESPQIDYESTKTGDNFQALLDNIARNTGMTSEETETDTESTKKIIIEEFVLSGGNISVKHQFLAGKTIDVPLPDLTLIDIGKKTNGATAQEAAGQIIKQITSAATGAITSSALMQQAKEQLSELKEEAKDKLEGKLGDKLNELDIGDEQVDKVKDLFKGLRK